MAKLDPCRTVSDAVLRRASKPVGSLVGGDYDKLWPDIERALHEQRIRDARVLESCRDELVF